MNALLANAIDAHGGLDRWKQFKIIQAEPKSSGELLERKVGESGPAMRFSAVTREQAVIASPVSGSDRSVVFRPDRVSIESQSAEVFAERRDPRAAFAGHDLNTPWDPLHRAYFSGYAMWSYLTTPFSFAMDGVQVWDIDSLEDDGEAWRGIRVVMPEGIATHSRAQEFYFGEDMLLRRQDYTIDIAGGYRIANYAHGIVDVDGLKIASKRRAYLCNKKYEVQRDRLIISLDLSNIRLKLPN